MCTNMPKLFCKGNARKQKCKKSATFSYIFRAHGCFGSRERRGEGGEKEKFSLRLLAGSAGMGAHGW